MALLAKQGFRIIQRPEALAIVNSYGWCIREGDVGKVPNDRQRRYGREGTFSFLKKVFIHPKKVMQQAQQFLTDFQDIQVIQQAFKDSSTSSNLIWIPPPAGVYKVNWDAAIKEEASKVGIGIVIRDFEGRVVASRSLQKFMFTDAFTAETQGALQAVCFAKDIGLRRIILQGDALNVVKSLKTDSSESHYSGVLLWDAKHILNQFDYWDVVHVKRQVNVAAHVLAKYGLSSDEDEVRLEDSHLCILPFI
ncbi:uncharacterized protein LOC122291053 [Carya illinoinensis]|uniref:uncharacterized protein LOC122291053 n=1 Tax=Carya illinoinensis TaxID=32201 RepID=UPI001C718485|nr:uncharacterized protein LOC122291053 [Carya illinoinensis]